MVRPAVVMLRAATVPCVIACSFTAATADARSHPPKKGDYVFRQDPGDGDDVVWPIQDFPRCGKSADVYLDNLRRVVVSYRSDFRFNGEVWTLQDNPEGVEAEKPARVNGGEVNALLWADKGEVGLDVAYFGWDETGGTIVCASARHFSLVSYR